MRRTLNPTEFGTMTGPPNASGPSIAKPGRGAGLRAWPLPAWIPDCICGKKIVERVRVDLGQTQPPKARILKSRGCDAMTGSGRPPRGGSGKSRRDTALAQNCRHRTAPWDMTRRNIDEGRRTTASNKAKLGLPRPPQPQDSSRGLCGGVAAVLIVHLVAPAQRSKLNPPLRSARKRNSAERIFTSASNSPRHRGVR